MNPLVINDEAAEELDEAIEYYEKKRRGLGIDLADKVSEAFLRIQRDPASILFTIKLAFRNTWSGDFPTLSTTQSLMITSRLLLLRTKSDDPIIGSSDNRSEWDVSRLG